jgi:hypothetical protein
MCEFADAIGIPRKAAEKLIDEMLDATDRVIFDLKDGVLPFNAKITSVWSRSLKNRRSQLLDPKR